MSWNVWCVYVLAYALVCLTPGPAVLFVSNQSAWRGRGAGVLAALGVETANIAYWALSALGLAALVASSQTIFTTLKWVGAAYLAWLGVRAIVSSFRREDVQAIKTVGARAYYDGFVVGLSNPKAMLFFVALLPQFVDASRAAAPQIVILAATSVVISFCCNAAYAAAVGQARQAIAGGPFGRWIERGVGCAFLSLAAASALVRRAS